MNKEDCILLGTLTKTHGISGGLVLITRIKGYSLKDKWESVFLEIDGILVPFFVASFEEGARDEMILYLDDITSRDLAGKLTGLKVYIQKKDIKLDKEGFDPMALTGYTLYDRQIGEIGVIKEIVRIPQNDLALVDYRGAEIQFPIQQELIEKIDHKSKIISINLPEGLLDL